MDIPHWWILSPQGGGQYARGEGVWIELPEFDDGETLPGGIIPNVRYDKQTLSDSEKAQARENIGVIEDAPRDSKQYARKNGDWEEVTCGGTFAKITEFTTDGTENNAVVLLDDFSTYKEIVIIMKAATPENAQLRIDAGDYSALGYWQAASNMWLSNTNAHYRMVWRIAIDDILTLTDCYAYNYSGDNTRLSIYKESGTCFGIDRTKKLAAFFYNNANAPAGKTFIVYAK